MHRTLKVALPVIFLAAAIGASFLMIQSRPEAMYQAGSACRPCWCR